MKGERLRVAFRRVVKKVWPIIDETLRQVRRLGTMHSFSQQGSKLRDNRGLDSFQDGR